MNLLRPSHEAPARRRLASLLAALALAIAWAMPAAATSQTGLAARSIDLQLLSINDFHGNLEPPSGSGGRINTPDGPVNAGGVEYLATHLAQLRQGHPTTLTVSAGDNIGASPLISGYFHDEPTIEALNALGLDISSVGNHEFDEGSAELLRMQNGGCRPTAPVDSCPFGTFGGANFEYLSANVVVNATGKTLFPAYEVRNVGGVKVAFIGLTLQGTPTIVTPAGVAGLTFLPEADTINAYVHQLQKNNVHTFVILLHEGGFQTLPPGTINDCDGISGAVVGITAALDPDVDVVLSGHTHQAYNCELPNAGGKDMLVTSGSSFGRLVTDVELKLDRATKDVVSASADNVIVTRDVTPDPAETAIVAKYNGLISAIKNQVVGSVADPDGLTRATTPAGESALGDVIADAQLAATDNEFGAQVAFMNPGGIRADVTCTTAACPVTYGDLFAVQPFGNALNTLDLTGAQIKTVLEQQFDNPGPGENRILSVSSNFSYSWNPAAAIGSRVSNVMLNGAPLDDATTYRVTANEFVAGGGDNFTTFRLGTNKVVGPNDLDALVAYFEANSPIAPPPLTRIALAP